MMIDFCTSKDLKEIRDLWQECFHDQEKFVDYYFQHKFDPNRVLVYRIENRIISMMHLNPYQVVYNDQIYPISYVVAVATKKEYQGRGHMRKLMDTALHFLYNQGEIFSLLMPIDSRIYERFGYGFIEEHLTIECVGDSFIHPSKLVQPLEAKENEIGKLVNLYHQFSSKFQMHTYRTASSFRNLLYELKSENGSIMLFSNGYLMIYTEENELKVREIVYTDRKTLFEMLSYIQEYSKDKKVTINTHTDSWIRHFLPNIRENVLKRTPFMMGRIIHLEKFIRENIGLFQNGIVLEVTDPILQQNNTTLLIQNKRIVKVDDLTPDYKLDIQSLTQIVFGYISTKESVILNPDNVVSEKSKLLRNGRKKYNFFNEYV